MEFRGDLPIYLQVVGKIKKDIANNRLSPGDKLPSTRELSIQLTINPNTAARVYRELEDEELTYTLRGRGTFVTDDHNKFRLVREELAEKAVSAFLREMDDMKFTREEIIAFLKGKMEVCDE